MVTEDRAEKLGIKEKKMECIEGIKHTRNLLLNKLTIILNFKIEKEINEFMEKQKNNSNPQLANKTSNAIITNFLQIVEITDEYLEAEEVKQVLKTPFQTLSQKYLTFLLQKGGKQKADVEILI